LNAAARAAEIEALLREEPALPRIREAFSRGELGDLLGWEVTADHVAALGRIERAAGRGLPRLWLLKLAVLAASVPPAALYDRLAAVGLQTEAKRVADLLLTAGRLPGPGDEAGQAEFVRMRPPAVLSDTLLLEVALTGRAGDDVRAIAGLAGLQNAVETWELRLQAPVAVASPGEGDGPVGGPPYELPPRGRRPEPPGRRASGRFGGGELLALAVAGGLLLAGLALGGWVLFGRTPGAGPSVANDIYIRATPGAVATLDTMGGRMVTVALADPWDAERPDIRVRVEGAGYGASRPGIWTLVLADGSVVVPVRTTSAAGEIALRPGGALPAGAAVVEVRFEPEDRSGSVTFYLD
jgi:hypothetical protein